MSPPTSRTLYDAATPGIPTLTPYYYHWDDILAAIYELNKGALEECIRPAGVYFIILIRKGEIPRGVVSEQALNGFVQEWAMALDLAYFFGNLLRHIEIKSCDDKTMGPRLGIYNYEEREIWLMETIEPGEQWDTSLAIQLIVTLLHEMMHAFFAMFLREELFRVSARHGGISERRHGAPWANAMVISGDSTKKEVPFPMDIPIFLSVATCMEADFWRPTPEEMRLWGASEYDIYKWQERSPPRQEFPLSVLIVLVLLGCIILFL